VVNNTTLATVGLLLRHQTSKKHCANAHKHKTKSTEQNSLWYGVKYLRHKISEPNCIIVNVESGSIPTGPANLLLIMRSANNYNIQRVQHNLLVEPEGGPRTKTSQVYECTYM
jgi:hypothetical protein